MDMPCTCPECGDVVELNNMQSTLGKLSYHSLVCQDCFECLEDEGNGFDGECEYCGSLLGIQSEIGIICPDCYEDSKSEEGFDDE